MHISILENNMSLFMDKSTIWYESHIWEIQSLLLWLNSHNEIMEKVPNHTLIGDSDEEYARLEEKIKFIEDLIQEISD